MTIRECIERVDTCKPNRFSFEEKKRWLAQIEGQVYREIIWPRESPQFKAPDITDDTDIEHILIATFPYDELYVLYLQCQIDLGNQEVGKYNNNRTLFNNALISFRDYWNRLYMPRRTVPFLSFDNGHRLPPYDGHPIYSAGNPLDVKKEPTRLRPVPLEFREPKDPYHRIQDDIRSINRTDKKQEGEITLLKEQKLDSEDALTTSEIGVILNG